MKRVLIIYKNDGLANSQRAEWLKKLLERKKYQVTLLDVVTFFDVYYSFFSDGIWLLVSGWLEYKLKRIFSIFKITPSFNRTQPLIRQLQKRGRLLGNSVVFRKHDVIICQNNHDLLSLLYADKKQVTIFDSPTPFSDELKYSREKKSEKELEKIAKLEEEVYSKVGGVCFNWYSYKMFYEATHGYSFSNYITANSGCTVPKNVATFSKKPKVVFIGNIDEYWSNKPLLKKLTQRLGSQLHIYGKTSDPFFLNSKSYQGYLPEKDHHVLASYQFGIITISKDPLRKYGFSAKHLMYLSYGLPVLVPAWRENDLLSSGSIRYTLETLPKVLEMYSVQNQWLVKHTAALKLRRQNTWEHNLDPLIKFIDEKYDQNFQSYH